MAKRICNSAKMRRYGIILGEDDIMKIAIFFPGIGYTNDKPLLYYARKLARQYGYEELCIEYHDLPGKVKGDKEKMMMAAHMAYEQAKEVLNGIEWAKYDEAILVGKSIGTVLAAKAAQEFETDAKLVLYTPVEATFMQEIKEAIAFIGEADPWSTLSEVKRLAKERKVPLHLYPECNHSLECGDMMRDVETLREVMTLTEEYIKNDGF